MMGDQAALETTVDFLVNGLLARRSRRKSRTRRAKKRDRRVSAARSPAPAVIPAQPGAK
jgi:hypothetical protein